jgi:hypothetical protein
MTLDEIVDALKNNPTNIDDVLAEAAVAFFRAEGAPGMNLLMSRVDIRPLNIKLTTVPSFLALVEEWALNKAPSPCMVNDAHCLHIEEVRFDDDDENEGTLEKRPVCCFCGDVFTDEEIVDPVGGEHGIFVGEPTRDALISQKNRMITLGRLHLHTIKHAMGEALLRHAAFIEEDLAETAGTDPNGPQKHDHLRSAESLRTLADSKV